MFAGGSKVVVHSPVGIRGKSPVAGMRTKSPAAEAF